MTTQEVFAVGDIVRLKSGSPRMTIAEIENEEILCIWFEGKQQHNQRFPTATLARDKESSGIIVRPRTPSRHSF